jgi:fructan beta-fructosidase
MQSIAKTFFSILVCFFMLSHQSAAVAQHPETPQYRPALHFSPASGWMNDPNGLVYADGVYHLFFQHYPDDSVWGPMHWGHATSRDLLHWEEQPIALYPDALGMIFSGSIVIDRDNTSGLGRDGVAPWVALFTHHNMAGEKAGRIDYQSQSIAYSLDQGKSWSKYAGNPVLPNPGLKHFRDPKVRWHEGARRWIMTLAAGDRILFYSSPDLKNWRQESSFAPFAVEEGNVVECPDLLAFEVDGKTRWVLLVSIFTGAPNGGSGTRYIVGDFDGTRFVPEHQDARWLDYGPDNYAGVTFHNLGERNLLIGWMSNWRYAQAVPTAPWRSAMTLPRELSLVEFGGKALLRQSVAAQVPDVAKLTLKASDLKTRQLRLSNAEGDHLFIGYDPAAKAYFIDRRNAGLTGFDGNFPIRATAPAIGDPTDVIVYLDKSSVELFADNGLTVLTSLVFPQTPFTRTTLIPF